MMVVDTSALVAIMRGEPEAKACTALIEAEPELLISAGTLAEAMVLATLRGWRRQLAALFEQVTFDIIPVNAASARRVGDIYARWGKGIHPASLNYGDCFAYELAESRGCKLLFIGSDFSRTDIPPALV
jgi:ribonuclease VapC